MNTTSLSQPNPKRDNTSAIERHDKAVVDLTLRKPTRWRLTAEGEAYLAEIRK